MKALFSALLFITLASARFTASAGQKPEPLSVMFNVQFTVTNVPGDLHRLFFATTGPSTGKDQSGLSGDGFFNIQLLPNPFIAVVSLTDADGDQIWFDLGGAQHPLEFSDLELLGYYDARAGGIYTVRGATGKYIGLRDKGTFAAQTKYYPHSQGQLRGEGTLALEGSSPIPPLPRPHSEQ